MSRDASFVPPHVERTLARWGLSPSARRSARLAPSRNVTAVCHRGNQLLFVKAAAGPGDGAVDAEAEVLPLLEAHLERAPGAPRVPSVFAALPGVLALDWLPGETLFARRLRGAADAGDRVGHALGVLHASTRDAAWLPGHAPLGDLVERLVWTSPDVYASLSPASLALWQRVQADDAATRSLIGLLEDEARGPVCYVHGDLRHPNILLHGPRVAFVDWELSGVGDPARDLGMLLAEDLAAYLVPPPGAPARLAALRRRLAAVLRGYGQGLSSLGAAPAPDLVPRATRWMAEALLRRAYTVAHHEGRFGEAEAHLVASALELLRRPARWARHFVGPAPRRAGTAARPGPGAGPRALRRRGPLGRSAPVTPAATSLAHRAAAGRWAGARR